MWNPLPEHYEQSSEDIWAAVCNCVRGALSAAGATADEVCGVAFDATCSLVLLDSDTTDEVAAAARGACGNSSEVCEVVLVKGLPRAEVGRLLAAARIVVDWCLIGTERMVVEAVLCGAVLLTSHCLCGTEPRDFPIPERNLLANRFRWRQSCHSTAVARPDLNFGGFSPLNRPTTYLRTGAKTRTA